jgi:hypothetical protein
MAKQRVSRRKSKRRQGGHLKPGAGMSLTKTAFDNGCGVRNQKRTRRYESSRAIAESQS